MNAKGSILTKKSAFITVILSSLVALLLFLWEHIEYQYYMHKVAKYYEKSAFYRGSNPDLKLYWEFDGFLTRALYDPICQKEANLKRVSEYVDKLCSNPSIKKSLLEVGRLESLIQLIDCAKNEIVDKNEYDSLEEWTSRQYEAKKKKYLFHDEDYVIRQESIARKARQLLVTSFMSKEELNGFFIDTRNKKDDFFRNRGFFNIPSGDGMTRESALHLTHLDTNSFRLFIDYAHEVLNCTCMTISEDYERTPGLFCLNLYQKERQKMFSFYVYLSKSDIEKTLYVFP